MLEAPFTDFFRGPPPMWAPRRQWRCFVEVENTNPRIVVVLVVQSVKVQLSHHGHHHNHTVVKPEYRRG